MKNKLHTTFLREYCKEKKMVRKEYKVFLSDREVEEFEGIVLQVGADWTFGRKKQEVLDWMRTQILESSKDLC